jgi:hypothetical protein
MQEIESLTYFGAVPQTVGSADIGLETAALCVGIAMTIIAILYLIWIVRH